MLQRIKKLMADTQVKSTVVNSPDLTLSLCVMLLEIAQADDEFTPDERTHVVRTLQERFSLSETETHELIEEAQGTREESLDLWQFTNKLNQEFDRGQKLLIMEEIWRVIYADGTLDSHEDYLVRKLSNLLNLSHKEMINAKLKVLKEIRS
ncbi:hypothetical protein CEE37_11835 [candidate division LCP-89 bacterium B3_LCP]|uniref:Co-chaperone DjlA N-terminal domain-containing protein n=1 Tax=candidate division LCP-89 bacterium B3_LCP TaxID=2012998 RepID=A0A532UVZ0_UNCL8|nr:MAG: hypothetical protein CEE37_11835 [candidate division LCP-89 bacterium B3_LCP]